MKKNLLFLTLLLIFLVGLTGCATKEKLFNKDNFKITLTDAFKEDDYKGASYYFISKKAGVTALEESYEELAKINLNSESTLDDYANAVMEANGKVIKMNKEDNFYYFTYDSTTENDRYYDMSALYKGKDGFWLLNFFGKYDDRKELEEEFLKYAKTVNVD